MTTPRGAWSGCVRLRAALLACLLVGFGCDDADPRLAPEFGPLPDMSEEDGSLPERDLALPDPDGGFDAGLDAGADAATDGQPSDLDVSDEGEGDGASDMALADMAPPDMAPDMAASPVCQRWLDVPDDELVARLHAVLHDTYRPIDVELDLGGNPNRYTTARNRMFTEVEWYDDPEQGGGYECVYTGRFIASPPDAEPDDEIMNCEHTWPRARMAPGGSLLYSHQQSDIHHLLPTISGVNSLRGSEHFGDVQNARNRDYLPAVYGTDASGSVVFQPRRERQGDIARVIFYFSVRWGRGIRDDEEAALRGWMRDDPVDRRERRRNDAIEAIQGNRNPFVDCPELVERIVDFADFQSIDTNENLPAP